METKIKIGLVFAVILGAVLAALGEISWWIPALLGVSGITLNIKH